MSVQAERDPKHTPVLLKKGYLRTPFTRASRPGKPGALGSIFQDELAALLINTIIERTGLEKSHVHQVIAGCAFPEGRNGFNIGRNVVLFPHCVLDMEKVSGKTTNMFCASSMDAIHQAASHISGKTMAMEHPVFIVGGMESMSSNSKMLGALPSINPKTAAALPVGCFDMLDTAENLQKLYEISRRDQERFTVESHLRAGRSGRFLKDEIVPVRVGCPPGNYERVWFTGEDDPVVRIVDKDDMVQDYGTMEAGMEKMRELRTNQPDGTVTAGTSSPFTDGVAFMVVTSEAYALANDLPIQARITACAQTACAPEIMGLGPVDSSMMAMQHAGWKMSDMDAIEGNEAFAVQILAVGREFNRIGKLTGMDLTIDPEKLNRHGGALGVGHPLGGSGARLVGTLGRTLETYNLRRGLATMCIGGGQGAATVLERYEYK